MRRLQLSTEMILPLKRNIANELREIARMARDIRSGDGNVEAYHFSR
jgi:hypothetical protein